MLSNPGLKNTDENRWVAFLENPNPLFVREFAEYALLKVSRTFALNIQVLPEPLKSEVLFAYLYCRIADTFEDDPELSVETKSALLKQFGDLFILDPKLFFPLNPSLDSHPEIQKLGKLIPSSWKKSDNWEKRLALQIPLVLQPFFAFPIEVRSILAKCLNEMTTGMADFNERRSSVTAGIPLIRDLADLDKYCYHVAGTVGVLLCDLFQHHSRSIKAETAKGLAERCISFGLGLQLTNILKDLHDDLARNVSFLPQSLLDEEGLQDGDFLRLQSRAAARRIYARLLKKAKTHLEDALEYSVLIPRLERRLRLFCLWPLFMAAETLALLAEKRDVLFEGQRVKIPRSKVKDIILKTSLFAFSNRWVRHEFRKAMARLEQSLA